MVEEHVKFLVGVVDTELFKRVGCEVFETKNVQDSNELSHIFTYNWAISEGERELSSYPG